MASGYNKVLLLGRLGADPELRYTTSGGAVAHFNLATNEAWVDKSGQKQERTEWHRIVVWGKLGELCSQYLSKGKLAFIEGRLQTREWTDKDGNKRYTTEIIAQSVQFIGNGSDRSFTPSSSSLPEGTGEGTVSSSNPSLSSMGEDDIPF